jgi:hypothetical protein
MMNCRAGVCLLLAVLFYGCFSSSSPGGAEITCGDEGICPTPLNAPAVCINGEHCGRAACEEGWFDFDGNETFGCEVNCNEEAACRLTDGTIKVFDAMPVPESGLVAGVFASNAPDAEEPRAVLGESTPTGSGLTSSAASGIMVIGFSAVQQDEW